jgi:DNA-directed RNA polymerase specialized sigma24 family protein
MSAAPLDPGSLKFQDYERLTHFLARKLCGWAQARGGSPDYDDLYQEVSLIWWRCRDQFDPTRGVLFPAYFAQAALHHWARVRREVERGRRTISLDQAPNAQIEASLAELLCDEHAGNPEMDALRQEAIAETLEASPLLLRMVELSLDPPEDLAQELVALRAQVAWSHDMGLGECETPAAALTPRLLSKTFRFNWRNRQLLLTEINKAFP